MIRPTSFVSLVLLWLGCCCSLLGAETYPLVQGEPMVGEPMPPTADPRGIIFKKPDGSVSERVGWTNFTQAALKKLAVNPKMKRFVETLIEPEIEETAAKQKIEIKPKEVPKLPRPDPKAGFGELFSSPIFLFIVFLLYAGNIYAGFEISVFRNYPAALVCGIAAVAPFLGPLIFLCLPTKMNVVREELTEEEQPVERFTVGDQTVEAPVETPEQVEANRTGHPQPVIYQRGQFVFNRRFFETKLAGFLRVVPGEAEKDLVLFVKSVRGDYVAPRLTRLTAEELVLQVRKGDATADVPIPFPEINEVQIRHKDAV
ncbi:MAG TPA: hypothetical protein VMZ27_09035 [Candidatus Saccharimonadales bacterium]|nr:hypothetical protein [Candidatus Saccharimonadales bacterium]